MWWADLTTEVTRPNKTLVQAHNALFTSFLGHVLKPYIKFNGGNFQQHIHYTQKLEKTQARDVIRIWV